MPVWFVRRDGEPLADARFERPLCRPGETAPPTAWTVITDDPGEVRDAVEAGASGVLVSVTDTLDAAGRMTIALSVIEAEQGVEDGALTLMALVSGPGAAMALAKGDLMPQRVLALGVDRAALLAAAGEAGAATATGLVALAAAARGIASFAANVGPDETSHIAWNQFALSLVASDNPPSGKNLSKP